MTLTPLDRRAALDADLLPDPAALDVQLEDLAELREEHAAAVAVPARSAVPSLLPAHKRKVRFHDLRHTCASLLIDAGASVVLVASRLGHADPSMTLRVYSHLYPSAEAALADALDQAHQASPVTPEHVRLQTETP